jgi:iron complex outermembrane receptor protein
LQPGDSFAAKQKGEPMSLKTKRHNGLLTSVATISIIASMSAPAIAQSNDEAVDEVTVTGIRQSIKSSIDAKRVASSIVEAVSAEDIGKLPDVSIAEAISRMPGLASQRTRGRSSVISIRGLGPDYTTALLNGREQVTANDSRGVEFDQYPAEMMSQVIVYKTPDAGLMGQGLAGTADLRTIRPLSYGRRALSVGMQYEDNSLGELSDGPDATGQRLTATYVDQNENGTLGWVIAFSDQTTPSQSERNIIDWNYGTASDSDSSIIPLGMKQAAESRELDRNAMAATVEFAPSEALSGSLDYFSTDFEDGGVLRRIQMPFSGWSGASLANGYTAAGGYVTQGTFEDVFTIIRNDARSRDADMDAIGLNLNYQVNDQLSVEFDYGSSEISRKDRDLETYSGPVDGNGDRVLSDINFERRADQTYRFTSDTNFADPSTIYLSDPGGWGQVGFDKTMSIDDELESLRLSALYEMGDDGFVTDVEIGFNNSVREKSHSSDENFLRLAAPIAVPTSIRQSPVDYGFVGFGNIMAYDPIAAVNSGIYTVAPNLGLGELQRRWNVEEDVTTLYAKANFTAEIAGKPVTGNLGVQYVMTDQTSTGITIDAASIAAATASGVYPTTTISHDYTNLLPSVNATMELDEDTLLRFGVAETLARPYMKDLRANQSVSSNSQICSVDGDGNFVYNANAVNLATGQTCLTSDGGNTTLEPIEAMSYDISYEKYFADGEGSLVAAYFYKDIDRWVFGSAQRILDLPEAATAIFGADIVAANPTITQVASSQPRNSDGGSMSGIELAANMPLSMVSDRLDGFGLYFSYAKLDSSIAPAGTDIEIPGLSDNIVNASVWYEKNGLSSRISYRRRAEFLGEIINYNGDPNNKRIGSEAVIDAQIGYELQTGQLQGLNLTLQAYNLTDEEFTQYDNGGLREHAVYGTTYMLGANYKF